MTTAADISPEAVEALALTTLEMAERGWCDTDIAAMLRAIAAERDELRAALTAAQNDIAACAAQCDKYRASLTARERQVESELGVLWYMVDNPSAWEDGFSRATSDTIRRVVTRIRAAMEKANG